MSADRFADRRRRRALEAAEAAGLAGLLVSPGPDLAYLTGYTPTPLERLTLLLLSPDAIRPWSSRRSSARSPSRRRRTGLEIVDWRDGRTTRTSWWPRCSARAATRSPTRPGRRTCSRSSTRTADCLFVAAGQALPLLRAVKDPDEVERLRAAGQAADAAFADVIACRSPAAPRSRSPRSSTACSGARNHRVGLRDRGSGPNAASRHHEPGRRRSRAGDAVVMDFGGVRDDYYSDITRTVFVGEPSDEERDGLRGGPGRPAGGVRGDPPGVAAQEVDRRPAR